MKKLRKLLAVLLVACMTMSLLSISALAEEEIPENPVGEIQPTTSWPLLEGEKTAKRTESDPNLYDVTVKVPGGDGVQEHDEVILMVDGSYSMDGEWTAMKKAIKLVGETVLNGTGNTQLTLMAFGISPNVVVKHAKSVEELTAGLPALPGGLLKGRSATNCDGAFEGIEAYIDAHDDTLRDVYVIFLSDGGVNLNSQPVDWIEVAGKISASDAAEVQSMEITMAALGYAKLSDATKGIYDSDLLAELAENWDSVLKLVNALYDLDDELEALKQEITALENRITALEAELDAIEDKTGEEYTEKADELADARSELAEKKTEKSALDTEHSEAYAAYMSAYAAANTATLAAANTVYDATTGKTCAQQWVLQVYKDFYAYANLTEGEKYPVQTAEFAYVDYQEAEDLYLYHTFYYVIGYAGIGSDWANDMTGYYAAESATSVAQREEVAKLYLVRYGSDNNDERWKWMTTIEGAEYAKSASISGLCTTLQGVLKDLQKTPYNDVTVTDYMSKWVNLKPETIKVVDDSQTVVAEFDAANSDAENGIYKYKWVGTPLCAEKAPIVLEKISSEDYADGGANVVGNTSGDIYRITWNIKDGPLYRADSYALTYQVLVDTAEEGFTYNQDYPANGNTDLNYTDENQTPKTNEIKVPEVTAPAYRVTVKYVDKASGSEIISSYVSDEASSGSPYDVTDKDQIEISGYTYDSTTGDELAGTLDENKLIIVYYTYNGGGTTGTPTTPTIPSNPTPPSTELEESEVPLMPAPEEGETPAPGAEEIFETDVPLATVPATGDVSALWLAVSALSGAGLFLTRKKREEDGE